MIDWASIDTVFLDMDGTLLDLHFDNYFWLQYLPLKLAEKQGKPVEDIQPNLDRLIEGEKGSLNWYCVDYWTETLDIDIKKLKEEVQHLIAFRPHVENFLAALKHTSHRVVLVTNAHRKSLDIKLKITKFDHYLDAIVVSHDLGLPKEDVNFWDKLQQTEPFNPDRTVLIDDSLSVLDSARTYGIKHLLSILKPDSQKPDRDIDGYHALDSFANITPTTTNNR